jgi:hypothetical protein
MKISHLFRYTTAWMSSAGGCGGNLIFAPLFHLKQKKLADIDFCLLVCVRLTQTKNETLSRI